MTMYLSCSNKSDSAHYGRKGHDTMKGKGFVPRMRSAVLQRGGVCALRTRMTVTLQRVQCRRTCAIQGSRDSACHTPYIMHKTSRQTLWFGSRLLV